MKEDAYGKLFHAYRQAQKKEGLLFSPKKYKWLLGINIIKDLENLTTEREAIDIFKKNNYLDTKIELFGIEVVGILIQDANNFQLFKEEYNYLDSVKKETEKLVNELTMKQVCEDFKDIFSKSNIKGDTYRCPECKHIYYLPLTLKPQKCVNCGCYLTTAKEDENE